MLSTNQIISDATQASIQSDASTGHSQRAVFRNFPEDTHASPVSDRNAHPSCISTDDTDSSFSSTGSAEFPSLPDSPRRGDHKLLSLIHPYFAMIELGREEAFRHIFNRMKKLNQINIKWKAPDLTRSSKSYYATGSTALINACRFIQPKIVEILLEESDGQIDVHECSDDGRDALMTAVSAYLRIDSPHDDERKADVMDIINQLLDKQASFLHVTPGEWSVFAMLLCDIKKIAQNRKLIDFFVSELYELILDILEQDCSQFYDLIHDLADPEKSKRFYSLYTEDEIQGYTNCFMNTLNEFIDDDFVAGRYGYRLRQFTLDYFNSCLPSKPQPLNTQSASSVSSTSNNGDNAALRDASEAESIRQRSQIETAQRQIMLLHQVYQLTISVSNLQIYSQNLQNNDHSLLWNYRTPASVPASGATPPLDPPPVTEDATILSFMRNHHM